MMTVKTFVGWTAGAMALLVASAPAWAQTGKRFPDVPQDQWAAQAVGALADKGVVIGYPDGTYGGPRPLTRYEFATAISRLLPVITQMINVPVNRPPQPDLSNLVTKEEFQRIKRNLVTQDQLKAALQGIQPQSPTALVPPSALKNYYTKAEIDNRFGDLNGKIDATNAKADALKSGVDRAGQDLHSLQADVDALKSGVTGR